MPCSLTMHACFHIARSNIYADLQLGWMEAEEGLLVVSEPLFFPRVTQSFTRHATYIETFHNHTTCTEALQPFNYAGRQRTIDDVVL